VAPRASHEEVCGSAKGRPAARGARLCERAAQRQAAQGAAPVRAVQEEDVSVPGTRPRAAATGLRAARTQGSHACSSQSGLCVRAPIWSDQ
jgi:hypothetical protein